MNTPQPNEFPDKEVRRRCSRLISRGAEEARALNHPYIGVEHLFIALTRREGGAAGRLLRRAGLSAKIVRSEIRREIGTGDGPLGDVLPLTPRAEMVLSIATFTATSDQRDDVSDGHLLLAMLQEGESVPVRKLAELGFDVDFWLNALLNEAYQQNMAALDGTSLFSAVEDDEPDASDERVVGSRDSGAADRVPTPLLDKYGRDLNEQAAQGKIGPVIARDEELRALARTLARSKKNNPLLLGDAGVGKTAVVEGLAYAIHDGSAPAALRGKRIVQIEIGTLVAGTSLRGQFEERLIGLVEEARLARNVLLFIDEIHTIVGAGDTIDSSLDAANILKPALARGEIVCIGATTHEEYRRAIAADPALDRRFRPIDIEEPGQDDALAILVSQRARLEAHHDVSIRPEALEAAVRLSVRYLPDRRLPDKAIDLMDEACARVVVRSGSGDEEDGVSEVRVENVAEVLAEWTGIPLTQLTTDERRRFSDVESVLRQRVIGQDEAVEAVAAAVRTARAGLGDPNRPIGVFLFLGPSGVGKTELARALAAFLFGSEEALLRLDMSEFHDAHTVSRLIGAPPGYKDADRGGQLTDGLRRRPYSVVLLDEVEKAAPEVFDLFLQVFDDGRLSDAHGGHVDARNAVFIMTSNIGTEETGKSVGFVASADRAPDYTAYLNRFFRPEFLNRLDEVVVFRPLAHEALSAILDLQLVQLRARLTTQGLELALTDDARAFILQRGYDPVNGARPLKRAVERLITRPLGARIVEEAFHAGDRIVADVDAAASRLTFAASVPAAGSSPPDSPSESAAPASA